MWFLKEVVSVSALSRAECLTFSAIRIACYVELKRPGNNWRVSGLVLSVDVTEYIRLSDL